MLDLLIDAAAAAKPETDKRRHSLHGCIGIRTDGTIVKARNGSSPGKSPYSHAEVRVCRKLNKGSTVYVARVLKNGAVANSKPCRTCMSMMRAKGISVVTYSLGPAEWKSVRL